MLSPMLAAMLIIALLITLIIIVGLVIILLTIITGPKYQVLTDLGNTDDYSVTVSQCHQPTIDNTDPKNPPRGNMDHSDLFK